MLPDPFQVTEARRDSTEIQQSGHPQGSGLEIKDEKVEPSKRIRRRTVEKETGHTLKLITYQFHPLLFTRK